jgi:hypothetical protein
MIEVKQVADVVEDELDRSRAARPYPYSQVEWNGTGET